MRDEDLARMGDASLTKFRIPLDCGHELVTIQKPPPKPDANVWCHKCLSYCIVPPGAKEWVVSCKNCTLTRQCGLDKTYAYRWGLRHMNRYTTHRMLLYPRGSPEVAEEIYLKDQPLPPASAGGMPF